MTHLFNVQERIPQVQHMDHVRVPLCVDPSNLIVCRFELCSRRYDDEVLGRSEQRGFRKSRSRKSMPYLVTDSSLSSTGEKSRSGGIAAWPSLFNLLKCAFRLLVQ